MISMSMVFAGLTSALVVRKAEGNWLVFDYPIWFYISTALITLSSFTMNWAKNNVKKDNLEMAQKGFLWTLALGLCFAFSQYLTWGALYNEGVYFTGPGSNASALFFMS